LLNCDSGVIVLTLLTVLSQDYCVALVIDAQVSDISWNLNSDRVVASTGEDNVLQVTSH
jgi:hypothetical protein